MTRYEQEATAFFDRVRLAASEVGEQELAEEMKIRFLAAENSGAAQVDHPLVVLTGMVAQLVGDPGMFELVHGTVHGWPHAWYEMVVVDKVHDPLPMRWIVDPAPIGSFTRPLGFPPNSPFQALYYKGDRS